MAGRTADISDRIGSYKSEMALLYIPGNFRLRADVYRQTLAGGADQPAVLSHARTLVRFLREKQILTTGADTFAGQTQYYDFSTSHPGRSEHGPAPLTYPFFCFDKEREVRLPGCAWPKRRRCGVWGPTTTMANHTALRQIDVFC
jgi:hypothetical protein